MKPLLVILLWKNLGIAEEKHLESCGKSLRKDFLLRNKLIFKNRKLRKVFHSYSHTFSQLTQGLLTRIVIILTFVRK